MKKVTVWLAILLCLTLISCSGQTDKIYKTLDGIDVSAQYTSFHIMVPNLAAPSLYTEQYPEEYEAVADFGKAGVPLVLDYVEEKELSVLNAAFFVCCCYGILEIGEEHHIHSLNVISLVNRPNILHKRYEIERIEVVLEIACKVLKILLNIGLILVIISHSHYERL